MEAEPGIEIRLAIRVHQGELGHYLASCARCPDYMGQGDTPEQAVSSFVSAIVTASRLDGSVRIAHEIKATGWELEGVTPIAIGDEVETTIEVPVLV